MKLGSQGMGEIKDFGWQKNVKEWYNRLSGGMSEWFKVTPC